MEKIRVLFVCIHNSGRSQMAEAFLRHLGGDRFDAHSAGLEAGTLNPLAVRAMAEIGVDMAGQYAKKVSDYVERGERFDYVITVCDESNAERCPLFPGKCERHHWSFPDPAALTGDDVAKLVGIRPIRDAIGAQVHAWLTELDVRQ
jgi:arsenate reductase